MLAAMASLTELSQTLVWSDFELVFEAQQDARLVAYPGSMLRGAFGHAFKDAVCLMAHRQCEGCLLHARCPYPYVFETPRPSGSDWMTRYDRVPHPFVLLSDFLEPPLLAAGDELRCGFRLFGPVHEMLPYFILAWERMGQQGLGARRVPFALRQVSARLPSGAWVPIYFPGQALNWPLAEARLQLPALSATDRYRLQLLTPVRLTQAGGLLQQHLPFGSLMASVLRRFSMLMYFHLGQQLQTDFAAITQAAAHVEVAESDLRWQDLPRWSNRQARKMNLGGLMGSVTYQGAGAFGVLLQLGEVLLVGKSTSFGLGRYQLNPV